MKIKLNGTVVYEGDNPDALTFDVDVAKGGEECGPVTINFRGGRLRVRCDGKASITLNGEEDGCLVIGDGTTGQIVPNPIYCAEPCLPRAMHIVEG